MKEAQRKHLEQRLLEERARTERALQRSDETTRTATEEDGDLTSYTQHPADEGTDTMEQEKALLMLSAEGQRLQQIDEALRRLYKEPDQFGKCIECGNEISMERLELIPWTTLCRDHQAESEGGS
ncbi:MAG TPA: TraR/DksA C4-type zinc finger protein [Longimicrobiales bacterium]|nr:TraR/DksA C4-type zinc finger protein [Longimicrobiales bacterium]